MAAINRELLAKVLGMLGSEHDGEVVAAARRAEQMRRAADISWEDILGGRGGSNGGRTFGHNPWADRYNRAHEEERQWRADQQQANRARREEAMRRNRAEREAREREQAEQAQRDQEEMEAQFAEFARDDEDVSDEEARKRDNRIKAATFILSVIHRFPNRYSSYEKLFAEMIKRNSGRLSNNQVVELKKLLQKSRVYAA